MTPEEIRAALMRALFPTYEEKFGFRPAWNELNVSSLAAGVVEFVRYKRASQNAPTDRQPAFSRHLLRGSAIDHMAKDRLAAEGWRTGDQKEEVLRHRVAYDWRTKKDAHEYFIIGHYDFFKDLGDKGILLEMKAPEYLRRFIGDGWLAHARRQASAYAKMLSVKNGYPVSAWVVAVNDDLHFYPLTDDEVERGWRGILETAMEAVEALDS